MFLAPTFYELLQVQEYPKSTGHYNAWHAETGTFEMSRRLFSFLLYLDDVEEGGDGDLDTNADGVVDVNDDGFEDADGDGFIDCDDPDCQVDAPGTITDD